jgi:hypothetical protein
MSDDSDNQTIEDSEKDISERGVTRNLAKDCDRSKERDELDRSKEDSFLNQPTKRANVIVK